MCVRAVKALVRLRTCAGASGHLMIKYSISVKSLTSQPISLLSSHFLLKIVVVLLFQFTQLYRLIRVIATNNFSAQFIKIISHYKKIGYNINVLQQTACLVVNPITVGNFAFLFNCTPVGRTSDSMMVLT